MPLLIADHTPAGSLSARPQPTLTGPDLILRPWQPADAPAAVAGYADPDIQYWHARTLTEEEALAWIANWHTRWAAESGAGFLVADAADGGPLGQISARLLDLKEGTCEISYWTLPAARGRRVAPKSLALIAGWLFDTVGVHRIEVRHSVRNTASCRVAELTGFPVEGTLRGSTKHADGFHDMHVHGCLATDPRPSVR